MWTALQKTFKSDQTSLIAVTKIVTGEPHSTKESFVVSNNTNGLRRAEVYTLIKVLQAALNDGDGFSGDSKESNSLT